MDSSQHNQLTEIKARLDSLATKYKIAHLGAPKSAASPLIKLRTLWQAHARTLAAFDRSLEKLKREMKRREAPRRHD